MRHVPVAVFKDKASHYIAAAEDGEEIIITRHGKDAVKLVSMRSEAQRRERAREALDTLLHHREKMRAEGRTATAEELIAWKNEGLR